MMTNILDQPSNKSDFGNGKRIVDVTVVLNIWKREYLEEQLASILLQTVVPKEIWIIHYENHISSSDTIDMFREFHSKVVLIKSDKNLKYFGRFSIAINVSTEFVWLVDDDIIPGSRWLENCVCKCDELDAIVSCTGRIIPKDEFQPENIDCENRRKCFVGDTAHQTINLCSVDTLVDYACNSYFFKTEWMKCYWSIWPTTFSSGEDIHLSATCKTLLGINTYVIKQTNKSTSGNIKRFYGNDKFASWMESNFIALREKVLRYHILENHWCPILWKP